VCCSVLQCVAVCCSVLQCVAVCCSVLQCVAVCCSLLQCVAVCCSVLQSVILTRRDTGLLDSISLLPVPLPPAFLTYLVLATPSPLHRLFLSLPLALLPPPQCPSQLLLFAHGSLQFVFQDLQ